MPAPTIVIVPGLRDHVAEHWQTCLAASLSEARTVPPMGRSDLDCGRRVEALQACLAQVAGPVVLVAHSGGVMTVVHWAQRHHRAIHAALLATPADFESAMPAGYPSMAELAAGGWLPIPRSTLPFRTIVAASRNDPLAKYDRVAAMARDWGAGLADLGDVGHLNPASGYGPWPRAMEFVATLSQ
jgi:predicted alpha/beta hydrolase family esterase